MTDTALLREQITQSGLKMFYIAQKLGLSRQQFTKKVDNKAPFSQLEIAGLCKILGISDLKVKDAIFFADRVD